MSGNGARIITAPPILSLAIALPASTVGVVGSTLLPTVVLLIVATIRRATVATTSACALLFKVILCRGVSSPLNCKLSRILPKMNKEDWRSNPRNSFSVVTVIIS